MGCIENICASAGWSVFVVAFWVMRWRRWRWSSLAFGGVPHRWHKYDNFSGLEWVHIYALYMKSKSDQRQVRGIKLRVCHSDLLLVVQR